MKKFIGIIKQWGKKGVGWFGRLSKKKKALVIFAVLVIVFVVGKIVGGNGNGKYTTEPVAQHDITQIVTETGAIHAASRTDIFSPGTGIIDTLLVSNGDTVTAEQELFTVQATATEQEEQAAYANYLAAQAALNAAQADSYSLRSAMFGNWDEYYKLATGDLYENSDGTPKNDQRALPEFHIASDDWLAAEKNYKDQQTVVAKAAASVTSTWLLYQATQNATVKALADGAIANLSVATGSSVMIKSATMTQPVLTIVTPHATEIVIPLSETDAIKVQPGQEVSIDVSAIGDTPYHGMVKRVDTIGTEVAGVVRYNAYIELIGSDEYIRPGMSVDVEIITKKIESVLSVPNAAVKPYQGGRAVRIVGKKGELEYVPVEIGIKGDKYTQILSGIQEGVQVVTALSNEQLKRKSLLGN